MQAGSSRRLGSCVYLVAREFVVERAELRVCFEVLGGVVLVGHVRRGSGWWLVRPRRVDWLVLVRTGLVGEAQLYRGPNLYLSFLSEKRVCITR
jgi:hypothetical protein